MRTHILIRLAGFLLILVGFPVFTGGGILFAIGNLIDSQLIGTFLIISGLTTVLTGLTLLLKPRTPE